LLQPNPLTNQPPIMVVQLVYPTIGTT